MLPSPRREPGDVLPRVSTLQHIDPSAASYGVTGFVCLPSSVGTGPLAANDPMTRGAGDVCFVSDLVSGALDGLGGSGGGAHSDNEWLDVASFRQATKRAAVFLHRLVTAPPPLRP